MSYYYFFATTVNELKIIINEHDNFLLPVEGIDSPAELIEIIENKSGKIRPNILMDSGVFSLVSYYARLNNLSINDCFSLDISKFSGYDALFSKYLSLIDALRDYLWGYIEIDIGDAERKTKTRQELENSGYKPIPVWHALNDDFDYLEFLCQNYKCIAIGNLSQSSNDLRMKIIYAVSLVKRQYPDVWFHALGISPTKILFAYPFDSSDSSSYLAHIKYTLTPGVFAGGNELKISTNLLKYSDGERSYALRVSAFSEHNRQIVVNNYYQYIGGNL